MENNVQHSEYVEIVFEYSGHSVIELSSQALHNYQPQQAQTWVMVDGKPTRATVSHRSAPGHPYTLER